MSAAWRARVCGKKKSYLKTSMSNSLARDPEKERHPPINSSILKLGYGHGFGCNGTNMNIHTLYYK